ncbi:exodeoxyribonuclease III [Inmirania thermothiophila]|uniref:Exodeoxyribonuclease-3 n=1 Tax=Inmirania thermothiophila TaxID=1750597 RepID=A0A3N1Y6Q2_9GAMM|nr:exodeoxyribonuclease III [Inmirania thermothiophila]ROR34483.1 exodeoxyribonuclease-3 [Inmirania thermothiophila]
MRVITLNVNGIRAAVGKGLYAWLPSQDADVICLQETKAQLGALPARYRTLPGYALYGCDAERKGYSGVAIFTRLPPREVRCGIGWEEADREGRYLQIDLGPVRVASVYVPSGSAGPERQEAKYRFLDAFLAFLRRLRGDGHEYILCGDWNIAHRPIDLANWRGNQRNSGFLPEERVWLDRVFDELGFVDAFRVVNREPGQYTWWSNRGRAWEKNVGWRIDYQIVTPGLRGRVRAAAIYREQRFSDHAPLIMDYDLEVPG